MDWSKQQANFLDWCVNGQGSCVLVAVAGAGKTTVLLEGGQRIRGQVAYMAYNRDIVSDTRTKLDKLGVSWKKIQANTAHGFGMSAYKKAQPNVRVDENKVWEILLKLVPDGSDLAIFRPAMSQLISLAKQRAFGILVPIDNFDSWARMSDHFDVFSGEDAPKNYAENGEDKTQFEVVIDRCIEALKKSNALLDVIDFDDMIYMPLIYRVRFWQFDVVMVDEAQDTNPARRLLVRAMLRRGGRVIAVGDPHQAIYGFTGADADALDLIEREFGATRLFLTITYRCPKAVVSFAHQWVKHIEAAETAPEGEISRVAMEAFFKRDDLIAGSAVLCRNTKPLVALAFALIRRKKACRIEGRDIAKSIAKLMTRWKVTKLHALIEKLDAYLARETTKLLAKKQETKLQQVEDSVETIKVIIDQCLSEKKDLVTDAVAYLELIFGDRVSDVLVLSTIHKSKGREWQNVFWLDRSGTCPSKWARQEWQMAQENNLCYVAATRSQDKLIELAAPLVKKAA